MLKFLHGIRLFMLSHGFSEVDRPGLTYDFYFLILKGNIHARFECFQLVKSL